jgi:drug/metabolite transporter (DMT)-like permease
VLIGARVDLDVPTALGTAWLMTTAALAFGVATLAAGAWDTQAALRGWPDLVGMVVLGTALPIPLLLAGLARVGPNRGSIISAIEPISAAVCGALFLGEPLGPPQLGGIALVLAALVVLTLRRRPAPERIDRDAAP